MSKEDIHAISFDLSSTIGSSTRISILFPDDYEFMVSRFEDYISGTKKHGPYIWKSIITRPHKCTKRKEYVLTLTYYADFLFEKQKDLTTKENEKNYGDLQV